MSGVDSQNISATAAEGAALLHAVEPSSRPKPCLIIEPRSGWAALDLRELWSYRDLFVAIAVRDIKIRYKQTALGVGWVVLQPLLAAAIFTVVFSFVAKLPAQGIPYFIFTYAGMLGWNTFNNTLTKSSACVVKNAQLVAKVYFPRLLLPLSTIPGTLLDVLVPMLLIVPMMIYHRVYPGFGVLLLPVWMAMLIMIAIGFGLLTSAIMVKYRDLSHVIPVLMQCMLYATPVAYSLAAVPAKIRPLFIINPLTGLLEAFRWSLLGRGELNPLALGYAAACALGLFLIGVPYFRRMEQRFADVI